MKNMRTCRRLVLVGMALGLVLAGCGDSDTPKSNETAITELILTIEGVDKTITFGTGDTANVKLSESTTPTMPTSATVKLVTLSAGASGLRNGDRVIIDAANRVAKIRITAEDGTTTKDYTVTVTIGAKPNLNTVELSYAAVTTTAGTATGVAPAWGTPTPGGITYSITASATDPPTTDGSVEGGPVAIDADGKITITAGAETENSGTYTVTATAGASSNYEANSMQTATVTVTVKIKGDLSDYGFSFSYPIAKRSDDGSISASPVWRKGTVDEAFPIEGMSYAVSTSSPLPIGVSLNADDGTITISDTMSSLDKVTAYQIEASGKGHDYQGSTTGTFLDKFLSEEYTQTVTGTAIRNLDDLKTMTLGGEYYLTAHIDLSTEVSWAPLGSYTTPFTGTLHGNGYAIYNLTINANADTQGLFAVVNGATIENLSIGVTNIKGRVGVGALAGGVTNATLSNIAVAPMAADAKIEGLDSGNASSFLGGLVGFQNGGSLTGYSLVTVEGTGNKVGGLAGDSENITVSGYATGDIIGKGDYVGGLVGYNKNSTVSGYATGDVTGEGDNVGGLVGWSKDSTVSGYATGAVSGASNVGGLIGHATTGSTVTGYATGVVTVTQGSQSGGLAGLNDGTVTGYWDKTSTGQDTSAGVADAVGITATKEIVFTTGTYTDSGNSNSEIFNIVAFTNVFDTANGASKTWPKLKSDNFDFPQPTVSDTDGNGVNVTY